MLGILEKLSLPDLAAIGFLALILFLGLVVFPLYLTFVALTGCGPPRVQSICSYILRRFKRRSKFNYHKIIPHVYLGSLPRTMGHLEELKALGVGAMVTLNEAWEMELSNSFVRDGCGIEHLHLPTPDFFAPKQRDIEEAVQFLERFVSKGIGVYVHCNGGKGRSAVCVICFMVSFMELSPETAYERVKSQRRIAPMRGRLGLHKQWRAVKRFCRRVVRLPRPLEAFEARPPDPEVTAKPLQLPAVVASLEPRKDLVPLPAPVDSPEIGRPPPEGAATPPEPLHVPPVSLAMAESSGSEEEPPLLE